MALLEKIKMLADQVFLQTVSDRRHLHANPELSFKEFATAAYLKKRLAEIGIKWTVMHTTGVVALIKGEKSGGEVMALRADIDALPIMEMSNMLYRSTNPGVMHACGHDAHTASLLGTATILYNLKKEFAGTVKLIFQPAEEILPGGAAGMIREGVLSSPVPRAIIAQHVMPVLPAGKVGFRKGKYMASMDEIRVTVYGKGGHGAQPHLNVDPVLIAAQLIVALQQVVSRIIDPIVPAVLSFGKVIADGAINVIPSTVYMEGTFRTFDEAGRVEAHLRMKQLAEGIAASMGGSCDFDITRGYPHLVNDDTLTTRIQQSMIDYMGEDNVVEMDQWMASEDFALYSQQLNACFYLLGTGNQIKETTTSLHTPLFNIDEDVLLHSTGLMAYIALKELGN
jgi:amidohydrolase